MGKVAGIVGVLFLLWLIYTGYFLMTLNPSVSAYWGPVEGDNVSIYFKIDLGNPSPVPIKLENLVLKLSGIPIAKVENVNLGFLKRDVSGSSEVNLNNLIDALIVHIKNKENSKIEVVGSVKILNIIPYNFSKDFEFRTNILEYLKNIRAEPRTYTVAGILPLKTPGVEGIYARWGKVSEDSLEVVGVVKLYNPNNFPLPIVNIGGEIYLNGIHVGRGSVMKTVTLPAKGRGEVPIRLQLYPKELKEALKSHILNGERSVLRLDLTFMLKVSGEVVEVKVGDIETTIETHILENIKV
ncbi:LEA type 2 family protein [Pyrococcus sp. ST04]|uniref:LEA type 2 family protein n=1 Tax=Pyrococcus sp. ST04 TaxID=1183377 RepID=UPI00026059CD|nr:LEA type 2 family protein [Pyrococcus sp. ST04]AFK21886.1 hypothetical protein Py04_0284 [Pyrococcus sp. ST04]